MAFDGGKSETSDSIVILHSVQNLYATKRFQLVWNKKTGTHKLKHQSYGSEKYFRVETVPVSGFDALQQALARVTKIPFAFVVRGEPLPDINRNYARRLTYPDRKTGDAATFTATPRHWFAIDIDHISAPPLLDIATAPDDAIEYLIGLLPPDVHDATCWWQFTSSQSLPDSGDTLSARLWFWNRVTLGDAELKRWATVANSHGKIIDPAIYTGVQPHYIAAPIFEDGMADPVPRRSGVRQGLEDETDLVIPPPSTKNSEIVSGEGYEPGLGVEAYLDQLGPNASNRQLIRSAICSYIALHGGKADIKPLYARTRAKLDEKVPGWRIDPRGERYADDDHLDAISVWVRTIHGDQPPKRPPPPEIPPEFDLDAPPPAEPEPGPALPVISIRAGKRHIAADQGLEAIGQAGIPFYQRSGELARICRIKAKAADKSTILVPGILPVRLPMLRRALGQAARWERFDKDGNAVATDPPKEIAEQIAEMIEEWSFPPLAGVIACPTLRPDGTLINKPGYDAATGLVLENNVKMPSIPAQPTKEDAKGALRFLEETLLAEFLFSSDKAGQAVARSQLITPVVRGAMPAAPMHLTTAPDAGTGKSYLGDIAAMIATGERCPVIALSKSAEENEKRLLGAALGGMQIIGIDNANQYLTGDFLCQVTERPLLLLRALGSTKMYRIDNNFSVLANGNNAGVADDLVRRTLTCSLDANMEDPENRTFKNSPLALVRADRGKYIAACLTITLAYIAAGKPDQRPALASYEAWSDLVRSPLVWLGCADPVETIASAREADPVRQRRRNVFSAWAAALRINVPYPTSEIIAVGEKHPEFGPALLEIASDRKQTDKIDSTRLGQWLRRNENTVADQRKLTADRSDKSRPKWQLVPL